MGNLKILQNFWKAELPKQNQKKRVAARGAADRHPDRSASTRPSRALASPCCRRMGIGRERGGAAGISALVPTVYLFL